MSTALAAKVLSKLDSTGQDELTGPSTTTRSSPRGKTLTRARAESDNAPPRARRRVVDQAVEAKSQTEQFFAERGALEPAPDDTTKQLEERSSDLAQFTVTPEKAAVTAVKPVAAIVALTIVNDGDTMLTLDVSGPPVASSTSAPLLKVVPTSSSATRVSRTITHRVPRPIEQGGQAQVELMIETEKLSIGAHSFTFQVTGLAGCAERMLERTRSITVDVKVCNFRSQADGLFRPYENAQRMANSFAADARRPTPRAREGVRGGAARPRPRRRARPRPRWTHEPRPARGRRLVHEPPQLKPRHGSSCASCRRTMPTT